VQWALKQQWNPLDNVLAYFTQDPNAFLVGKLNGIPVAAISAIKYDKYSFLGLYIVDEKYRGHGYGKKLFDKAMEYAKGPNNDCVVGLDGVLQQVENYKKSGFEPVFVSMGYHF